MKSGLLEGWRPKLVAKMHYCWTKPSCHQILGTGPFPLQHSFGKISPAFREPCIHGHVDGELASAVSEWSQDRRGTGDAQADRANADRRDRQKHSTELTELSTSDGHPKTKIHDVRAATAHTHVLSVSQNVPALGKSRDRPFGSG
jgi:hypothetical protein